MKGREEVALPRRSASQLPLAHRLAALAHVTVKKSCCLNEALLRCLRVHRPMALRFRLADCLTALRLPLADCLAALRLLMAHRLTALAYELVQAVASIRRVLREARAS